MILEIFEMNLTEETKASLVAVTFFILFLLTIGICWHVYNVQYNRSISEISLSMRCRESGGSMIEGESNTGGDTTHFSICVPAEAFYCADIE
jgi:hypothetical protein